jgi:uncharacterized repeat protein (TIGR01451 family)
VKNAALAAVIFLSSGILLADISLTDRATTLRALKADPSLLTPATGDSHKTKQEKADARRNRLAISALSLHPHVLSNGAVNLIDASGLKYLINTDMTLVTASSASGAASDAAYTASVVATTQGGGTQLALLNDAFDGYNAICISLTGASGPCSKTNPIYTMYNQNGPASFDATVPPGPNCTNRQLVLPAKTIGPISVQRRVYVPPNDTYIRWLNSFTNTSGAPVTFTMVTSNNLGSDSNTVIVTSSNGDAVAQTTDTWVTTFQNYSAGTSSDPRIGHVLQGVGTSTPITAISFANGDDNPFWTYSITLAPGQTKIILNFATGQPSKAAAAAKAASLATLPVAATQCLSAAQLALVTNFAPPVDLSITKTTASASVTSGNPISYTLAVSNLSVSPATAVSVSDTLPVGAGFISASGTGWTCGIASNVVTCTLPTLNTGSATPITLSITAPIAGSPSTLANTASVSSAASDPNPANNSSTSTVPLLAGTQIPAMSGLLLALLAAMLGLIAIARRM